MLDKALSLIGLQRKSLSDPSVELLSLFGATPTASGVAVSADSAMTCGPAYACVRLLADTVEPIAFGDFNTAYRIVDRLALSILVDPYTQATKGITRFHATRRTGGRVLVPAAIRKIRVAA